MHRLTQRTLLAIRIALLAAAPFDRALLLGWSIRATIDQAKGKPLPALRVRIRFPGLNQRIEFRTLADLWVLKDVLLEREYEVSFPKDPRVVLDLGANIGISAVYLAARYPKAIIHAVEPNPQLRPQLEANAAGLNVRIHACALADHDGQALLTVGKSSAASSIMTKGKGSEIEVEAVTLQTLLARMNCDRIGLVKFDIEGAEEYLFSEPAPTDAYVGEVHYDKMSLTRERIRSRLAGYVLSERAAGRPDRDLLYAYRANASADSK